MELKFYYGFQSSSVTPVAVTTTFATLPTASVGAGTNIKLTIGLGAGIPAGLVLLLLLIVAVKYCFKSRRRRQLRRELMRDYYCDRTDADSHDGDYVQYSDGSSLDMLTPAYPMKIHEDNRQMPVSVLQDGKPYGRFSQGSDHSRGGDDDDGGSQLTDYLLAYDSEPL